MTTRILDLTGVVDDNPYLPSDSVQGSFFTSLDADAEVFSQELYGSVATWRCDDVLPNEFTVDMFFPQINSNSRGPVLLNASGNGIGFLIRDSDIRVFEYASNALTGSALATYSVSVITNDTITVEVNQSASTYLIKKNGTLVGTYNQSGLSGLFAGFTLRGGTFRTWTLNYSSGPVLTIDSTPADIRVTESRTIRVTPPTTAITTGNTSIYINADTAAAITLSSVTTVSGLTVDIVFTVPDEYAGLPYSATGYAIIVSTADGDATSANVPYLPVTGNDDVTLTDVSATDIESSPALEVDDQIEWTNAAVITIGADGKVTSTEESATFEFRVWDHNDSSWGDWAEVVFGESGGSTGVLTASSLTTSGLTVAGLTRSGLSS
jgi:hypothetical protein